MALGSPSPVSALLQPETAAPRPSRRRGSARRRTAEPGQLAPASRRFQLDRRADRPRDAARQHVPLHYIPRPQQMHEKFQARTEGTSAAMLLGWIASGKFQLFQPPFLPPRMKQVQCSDNLLFLSTNHHLSRHCHASAADLVGHRARPMQSLLRVVQPV